MREHSRLLPHPEALSRILDALTPLPGELTASESALGRALASDVRALRTLPPWDNSAMDGYAVRASDLGSLPRRLKVTETVYAGQLSSRALGPGECARIMTGAPLPPGADAVVMQEKTRRALDDGACVEILEAVSLGAAIRSAGEDAREGELLLPGGSAVGIAEVGLLLGQGLASVQVHRRPRVAILSTGDELCRPDEVPEGRIVDTNSAMLALAVQRAGGTAVRLGIAPDRLDAIKAKLEQARGFDVVLTSAGVSVGDHDFVKEALEETGVRTEFWRVAIRPGKPLAFGRRESSLFFGLPGNPTSSLVTFELFVRPALRKLQGLPVMGAWSVGCSAVELKKAGGLAHFIRCRAEWRDGALWATPLLSQTSGAVRSAATCTHLLHFPMGSEKLEAGSEVELLAVSWGS